MKVKTSDLTGAALDWAVGYARCLTATNGKPILARDLMDAAMRNGMSSPSTDWAQGGPIIEWGHIHTWTDRKDAAYAGHPDSYWVAEMTEIGGIWWGPTPLIAAMRCFCASRLGDEIEVPDEIA